MSQVSAAARMPISFATSLSASVELLKPITWFAPMWAFGCGIVSSGLPLSDRWDTIALGILVAGPLVCGTSQAINDWLDRDIDAINEPNRPIPSGRVPGRRGLYLGIGWTLLSLAVATAIGRWGFGAAALGLALAWAYSAPTYVTGMDCSLADTTVSGSAIANLNLPAPTALIRSGLVPLSNEMSMPWSL